MTMTSMRTGASILFSRLLAILILMLVPGLAAAAEFTDKFLQWETMPALPRGLAGQFAGAGQHTGVNADPSLDSSHILVAGGASFPEAPPWEGGSKVWHDDVYGLVAGTDAWSVAGKLPRPTAYGVSISSLDGLICIGGGDDERHFQEVFLLRWDVSGSQLKEEALPNLPGPCAFMTGALLGNAIYIAGGQAAPDSKEALKVFWRLDLSEPSEGEPARARAWEVLEPWPGPERILAVSAVQDGTLILASGARLVSDRAGGVTREFLTDAYRYHPKSGWRTIAPTPAPVVAASAVALGNSHVLVFSGDDGSQFGRVSELKENHPGFRRDVLAYETITDTWRVIDTMPEGLVTTNAVRWRRVRMGETVETVVIASGEDRPGHRSTSVFETPTAKRESPFHPLDYVALVAYLAALVCMGFYFSRRGKTTEDFFLAGRRIPWWAATLSIFSTQLSAITFMAIPATAYATNWVTILMNFGILLVAPIMVLTSLPFLRRLNLTTIFEYLELRFNVIIRMYGSLAFVSYQLARTGIVLLLPSLALSTVTGFSLYVCIVIMGLLCTLYTVLGGIEAVIWTDVLQSFVLVGGAIVCLVVVAFGVEGGVSGVWDTALNHDKFHIFNMNGGPASMAAWVLIVGGFFTQLVPYISDQALLQRLLTTPTEKQAVRSVWVHALIVIPASLLFFGLGTALFAFFKSNPEALNASARSNDIILPWFVATQFPAGLAGLVIAGLFAATMSSVDSSINSVATCLVTDFDRKIRPDVDDASRLRLAKSLTIIVGILATLSAIAVSLMDAKSLWSLILKFAGLFGSSLTGTLLLGMCTQRANSHGMAVGIVTSMVVLYVVQRMDPPLVHGFLYAAVGIVTCVIVGYAASIALGGETRSGAGLTLKTLKKQEE